MLATRDAPQSGSDTPARRAAEQRATFDMLEQALNTPAHMNHETASLADNEHQQRTQREDAGTAKKRSKEQQQADFRAWRREEEQRREEVAAKEREEEERQADLIAANKRAEEKRQADIRAAEEEQRQATLRTARKREAELDEQQHAALEHEASAQLERSVADYGDHPRPSSGSKGKYFHEQTLANFFADVGDTDNAGRIAIHDILDEYVRPHQP